MAEPDTVDDIVLYQKKTIHAANGIDIRLPNGSPMEFNGNPFQTSSIKYVAADFLTSDGVALQNVPGMSWPVEANGIYVFEFILQVIVAAATTGAQFALGGPAAPDYFIWAEASPVSAGTLLFASVAALDTVLANNAGVTAFPVQSHVTGFLDNGPNAGAAQFKIKSEVDTSQITLKRGSWGRMTQVG